LSYYTLNKPRFQENFKKTRVFILFAENAKLNASGKGIRLKNGQRLQNEKRLTGD
jgi:hypothetical protein